MSNTPRTACASECFATPSAVASMYSTNVCSPSAMVGPSTTTSTRRPMRAGAPWYLRRCRQPSCRDSRHWYEHSGLRSSTWRFTVGYSAGGNRCNSVLTSVKPSRSVARRTCGKPHASEKRFSLQVWPLPPSTSVTSSSSSITSSSVTLHTSRPVPCEECALSAVATKKYGFAGRRGSEYSRRSASPSAGRKFVSLGPRCRLRTRRSTSMAFCVSSVAVGIAARRARSRRDLAQLASPETFADRVRRVAWRRLRLRARAPWSLAVNNRSTRV